MYYIGTKYGGVMWWKYNTIVTPVHNIYVTIMQVDIHIALIFCQVDVMISWRTTNNFQAYIYLYIFVYFCAKSRKVAGSIPDGVVGIFDWHNPSDRTMALGLTQLLTGMSTKNISWR